jgi:hypothetical protein
MGFATGRRNVRLRQANGGRMLRQDGPVSETRTWSLKRVPNTERPQKPPEECCHFQAPIFHICPSSSSCRIFLLGGWVLHLRPRRLYDMSATLSAIFRLRDFDQYAQTLSSPFLLMFVLFQACFKDAPVRNPRVVRIVADVEFVYSRRLRSATATLPKYLTESCIIDKVLRRTKDL